jgi:protein gp37
VNKQGPNGIGWCDYTWSPIVGCSPVSEGCSACYAEAISRRFGLPWGKAVFKPERLGEPAKVKKPGRIFVCSMSDLFHEAVETEWRDAVYRTIEDCPWHTFIILTKRPEIAMRDILGQDLRRRLYPNVWLGVTAENQARADERIPILLRIPAAVRFVSVEPMLGAVDLTPYISGGLTGGGFLDGLSWVIAGPETGPKARLCCDSWLCDLAAQCYAEGVPFFDKRTPGIRREWPKAKGAST